MEGLDAHLTVKPIDSTVQVGAYEFLWQHRDATNKRVADLSRANPGGLPSELVDGTDAALAAEKVFVHFTSRSIDCFGFHNHEVPDYPLRLLDATDPIELLYFLGSWELPKHHAPLLKTS